MVPVDFHHILQFFSFLIGPKTHVLAIRKAEMAELARVKWKKSLGTEHAKCAFLGQTGRGGGETRQEYLPKYEQLYVETAIWSSPQLIVRGYRKQLFLLVLLVFVVRTVVPRFRT